MDQVKLESIIQETATYFSLPSVSVSIAANGKTFHKSIGYTHIEEKIPATKDSIYAVGSSTKAFVALAVNILAAEKKIDLDTPVSTYIKDFSMFDPYATEHLTMRDALSHRTGMPRHDLAWLNNKNRSLKEQALSLSHLPPAWSMRYRFQYQNHMFILASLLVEEISGMPWGDFIKRRIFDPLDMKNSYISGDMVPETNTAKAVPYMRDGTKYIAIPYNYAPSVAGAGTIFSSTFDMLKWLQFQINGNEAVIPTNQLSAMQAPQMVIKEGEMQPKEYPEINFTSYAMAWFTESYRGIKILHHGGTIDGFKSEQIFAPSKNIAISLLTNVNRTQSLSALGYTLLDELCKLPSVDWNQRFLAAEKEVLVQLESGKPVIKTLETFSVSSDQTGSFSHPAYGKITLTDEDGQLFMDFCGYHLPLKAVSTDVFHGSLEVFHRHFPVSIIRDESGQVTALHIPLEPLIEAPIVFEKI